MRKARRAALALLALSLPLSLAATNAALVLLTAVLLAEFWTEGGFSRLKELKAPVVYALAAYVLWGFTDSLFGLSPSQSLIFVFRHEFHMLWALAALTLALRRDDFPEAWAWLGLGFSAIVLVGLGQTAISVSASGPAGAFRAAHGFLHPLFYGQMLALGLILGFLAVAGPQPLARGRARTAAWLLLALGAAAFYVNQTRNAWLGVLVAAAGLALVSRKQSSAAARLSTLALLCAVAAGLWSMGKLQPGHSLTSALTTVEKAAPAADPFNADSDHTRLMLASIGWTMFKDHPWLGVGPDQYHAAYPRYYQQTLEGTPVWGDAHNFYLNTLATQGIPGLLALLAFFFFLGRESWRAARESPSAGSWLALGASACFFTMVFFEVHRQQATTLFLFLWAWGMARSHA